MGQYSQWLRHREIDQQLQSQQARLEQDLRNLQEQARHLEVHDYHAPNSIIQALQQSTHTNARPTTSSLDTPSTHHLPVPEPHTPSTAMPTTASIPSIPSHPLWTPLPDTIERGRYTNPRLPTRHTALKAAQLTSGTARSTSTALQAVSNMHVVPAHNTSPQEALKYTGHPRPTNRTLPVDPQDEHTDQMIQRWLERWGKHQQEKQNIQDT